MNYYLKQKRPLHEHKELTKLFGQVKDDYSEFNKSGYISDDQFALFSNVLEDFQAYYAMYIAIRSSDWVLRNSALMDGNEIRTIRIFSL